MDGLITDLRGALRTLQHRPLVSLAAVLSLALGIGATSTVFSLVRGVLVKPLPYEQADRLYMVWNHFPSEGRPRTPLSGWEFQDLQSLDRSFAEVGGMITWFFDLTSLETPRRAVGARMSAGALRALGSDMALGRAYSEEEQEQGDRLVVLSHGLWQRAFGGDRDVVGKTVSLGRLPYTVVGVLAEGFRSMPPIAELWVPLTPNPAVPRNLRAVLTLVRLQPGISAQQARADLDALAQRFRQDHPELYTKDPGWHLGLQPLQAQAVGDTGPRLLTFQAAVLLVLLLACANVTHLLLAQASTREKEIALRAALGASRASLLRQSLCEGVLLALAGGALGLTLTHYGLQLLSRQQAAAIPRLEEVGVDPAVLLVTILVSLGSGLLTALAPALAAARPDLQGVLREGGRGSAGRARHPLRRALVVAEVALATLILLGAGILLRSFAQLQSIDPGFRSQGIRSMQLYLPPAAYPKAQDQRAFVQRLREALDRRPDLGRAALVAQLPLGRTRLSGSVHGEGHDADAAPVELGWNMADHAFFSALEIPLLRGRVFGAQDHAEASPVVVIDQGSARRLWGDQDPIGRRLRLQDGRQDLAPQDGWRTVIGVVASVHQHGLATDAYDQIYLPLDQYPSHGVGLLLRSEERPEQVAAALRSIVRGVDPQLPLDEVRSLDDMVQGSLAGPRFNLSLVLIFATLALVLAVVGIYGLSAYTVSRRTRELGVRRSLGASTAQLHRLVLGEGLRLAGVGLVLGMGLTWLLHGWLDRALAHLVRDSSLVDPWVLLAVPVLLLATSVLACLLPARRAARVPPTVAMGQD